MSSTHSHTDVSVWTIELSIIKKITFFMFVSNGNRTRTLSRFLQNISEMETSKLSRNLRYCNPENVSNSAKIWNS